MIPVHPNLQDVEQASALQRRLYRTIRETMRAMAGVVNLNPKYLGEIERGEKIISIEVLLRVAKAVKTPMSEFFVGL